MARPVKYTKKEEIKPLIDQYFIDCDDKKEIISDVSGKYKIIYEPYTVSGLCMALDMCRDTLCEYEKQEEFSDTIKGAKRRIENWIETKALNGMINPTVSIFNLKNNFGWKDKTETELSNKEGETFKTTNMSNNELDSKLAELMALNSKKP